MRGAVLFWAAFLLLAGSAASGFAASHSAPHSGLDSDRRHSYGPDGEGRRDPRLMTSMPNDAYGNPVVPMEEPEKKRHRMRPGAYGSAQDAPQALPKLPEHDAGWNFK